jgi:hypothetical protein
LDFIEDEYGAVSVPSLPEFFQKAGHGHLDPPDANDALHDDGTVFFRREQLSGCLAIVQIDKGGR